MTVNPQEIRAERHTDVGAVLQRDATVIVERWGRRAMEEQPNAQRVHHATLFDHLPIFLAEMGRSLAESDTGNGRAHCEPAQKHGEHRWETGWSLAEVVRDYQILRLVILEYLEEALERPLRSPEVMAVGLALDEAIAASVRSYVAQQEEAVRQAERDRAARQKQAEEAARMQQLEALKEAERRKDEFLGMLGHELRNPLAPIRNALQILRLRGGEPDTVIWSTDLLDRQVRHMTRLIEELLDVTRLGRGKMLLRRETVNLAQLVSATAEDHRVTIEEAGLHLQVEVAAEPLPIVGDPTRLAQVVGNLLHNAAKFTEAGGRITVRVERDEATQRAKITVQDTGIGIAPELLPHVFEMFTQADNSATRSRGGLGLGLALVKGLVELQSGEVQAASAGAGQGATFTSWFPLADESAAPAPTAGPPTKTGARRRILVVDDNRDATDSLRLLLEVRGHEVAVAYSGPDGVETARRFQPELVLCDLGLPGMDGYAVARALKEERATAGVRLIAVSGYGSPTEQQRALEAGFERHLAKPVEPEELLRLLQEDGQEGEAL
jgi:signal transduction histidine kinase/ActR/RegA family two-component response regulator